MVELKIRNEKVVFKLINKQGRCINLRKEEQKEKKCGMNKWKGINANLQN